MEETFESLIRSYGPYFEDAKRRLISLALMFSALFISVFFLSPLLINQLIELLQLPGVEYVANAPFQILGLSLNLAFTAALVGTTPLFLVEVYEFITPALDKEERATLIKVVLASAFLFIVGCAYGVAVMYFGYGLASVYNANVGLQNLWDIDTFFSQLVMSSVLLGFLFQFPLIMALMLFLRLISLENLTAHRNLIYAAVFIIVALLPPIDGLSLIAMAIPLIGLYELTVFVAKTHATPHRARKGVVIL